MPELLVNVYRNELVESAHYGQIMVVDKNGQLMAVVGDEDYVTYWRSASKPFQALPVVYSGAASKYNLTEEELAIMTASHSGEKKHIQIVQGILDKIGLDKSALLCGIHPPYHKPSALEIYRQGKEPETLHNNCSGKHAGLLTLCRYYKWSIDNYLDPEHPLQQMLLDLMADITQYPREKIRLGTDGCGVVVYGLPLKNMAYAYARLANYDSLPVDYQEAARVILKAMKDHPYIVGGSGRFNTALLEMAGDRLIAKTGAEAVFCIGVENGPGIAIKIIDGRSRAISAVAVELLSQLNVLDENEKEKMFDHHYPAVKNNHGNKVGRMEPVYELEWIRQDSFNNIENIYNKEKR